MRERAQLADQGRRRVLRDHVAGVDAAAGRQERRQPLVGERIHQPVDAPLADAAELGQAHGQRVERQPQHLAVEVAAAQHDAVVGKHERVVRHGAELAPEHAAGEVEGRARRAVHLRHAAQAVGVLHARAVAVRLDDAAGRGEPAEVGRHRLLRGVRPQRVDARVERRVGAHQRLERHGAGHVGQPRQPAGVEHGQRAQPRHEVRAVQQRQAFLGLERQRPHAGGLQRLARRHSAPVRHGLALADQAGRHVRERSEIARRSHRALLGHHGMHAAIQARHQGLDHARPDARGAASQRRGEQQDHRARLGLGERGTDATGVAQHEVALQRGALGRRNHHVLELADAGGDAVDRLGAAGEPIDERAAGRQPRGGGGPQRDLAAPRAPRPRRRRA